MIALTKGSSPMSRIIRFTNWSEYSHAAWIDPDDRSCWESLPFKGVVHSSSINDQHCNGTPVDIFLFDYTADQLRAIRCFMTAQLGKDYDWDSVLHFISKRPPLASDQNKWFCSELIFAAHLYAGIDLLARIPAWKVYPGMIAYSPLLQFLESDFTRRLSPHVFGSSSQVSSFRFQVSGLPA
jgi:uncharacterized protein YycO